MDYVDKIENAQVYDDAKITPLVEAHKLSSQLRNTVLLKREDLQPTYTFKVRGAANKIASLSKDQLAAGVVCSSAGNHAQGVALAASRKGVRAEIVMPAATPAIKVEAVQALGGNVTLHGDDYDAAQSRAYELAEEEGLQLIHPFDDPEVIAGQGTIGKELLDQHGAFDAVFVAVGGGGLAAGVAAYIKAKRPEVSVIGVEPFDNASMHAAFAAGAPVELDRVGIFAESVATRRVGTETFRLCSELLDEVITVSTDQICAAIKDVFEATRGLVEPAGALALAGLKQHVSDLGWEGKTLVAINCGANMNFERLRYISERAAIGERTEALLAVEIPERKGSFLAFCTAIGNRHVTEFNYRFQSNASAHIFVGLELTKGHAELPELISQLERLKYDVTDLTDNELAKTHVRHLVGGARQPEGEKLFRFEFPERRGALLQFLKAIGQDWNISLFHYRNYGSDYGRVLVGIGVGEREEAVLIKHFDELGYPYWDETDNAAYRLFLRS